MATNEVKRKLTAILSADVVGYSRLMGDDEVATVEALTSHKETMRKLIRHYRGRVVDSTGDNLMAEFASVVDAVQCAVEIQQVLSSKNEHLPDNRKMLFRIGINLGDVIEEGDRIYGDGVNIAARIEALADTGGVCISGSAYEQIENKLALGYQYMGEHTVKNIAKPVKVYKVPMGPVEIVKKKLVINKWQKTAIAAVAILIFAGAAGVIWNYYFRPPPIEPASLEKMAFPLPEKASIAVLPFTNMSGDPKQEYFSDGLTEEIISALSRVPKLFVIARNSTFTYKGRPVKVQQVSEELGVRYVLEGGVRKAEDRVRITAQLIDATTGHHLWSERYDGDLKDIFALQDQITLKILNALQVTLTEGEAFSAAVKGTHNLDAYLKWLRSREYMLSYTKEGNASSRNLNEEAIALDPGFPLPYLYISATHIIDSMFGWSESSKQSLKLAEEMVQKALALDDNLGVAHAFLGRIYLTKRKYEEAIAEGERAIVLAPNLDFAYAALAYTLHRVGRQEEAIGLYKKAIRLNPHAPGWYFSGLGSCYRMVGQYQEGVSEHRRNLQKTPTRLSDHIALAATYILMGREENARAEAEEVLRLYPKFSVRHFAEQQKYRDQADTDRLVAALRKAGLPESPALPLPDKPSIAVLPFVNMSGDPQQEYFGDGISEEIITALSRTPKMFVIARTSSFKYKGKEVDVRTVGRELGVRYVLEGSVRKSEDQLRITVQLVDGKTGNHLWAERYDRNLKDIFEVQDEITQKIVTALRIRLTEGEQANMWGKKAKNLDVYLKGLKAQALWNEGTKQSYIKFRQVAQELIDMAPESGFGYTALGWSHWIDAIYGWSKTPRQSIGKAYELAQKALAIDESDSSSHTLLGSVYLLMRQYEKAIAEGERAVALNPNGAFDHGLLGMTLSYAGRQDEAIDHLMQGIRLNPFPEYWYFSNLGRCYAMKGQHEEALGELKKALHRSPDAIVVHLQLTVIYITLDQQEKARASAKKVLEIDPKFSVERASKGWPYRTQADTERIINALHKAGLK